MGGGIFGAQQAQRHANLMRASARMWALYKGPAVLHYAGPRARALTLTRKLSQTLYMRR